MAKFRKTGGLTLGELQRKVKNKEKLTPEEQKQIAAFGEAIDFAFLRTIVETQKAVAKQFSELSRAIVLPIESIKRMSDEMTKIARSLSEPMKRIGEMIREWARQFLEPFNILWKSNIFLIIKASEGDELALDKLGRLWWKLEMDYMRLEWKKGRKPTKEEFRAVVAEACWEALNPTEAPAVPVVKIARYVFYSIVARLLADWAEFHDSARNSGGSAIDVLADQGEQDGRYLSASVYHGDLRKPYFFVKTAAEVAGVTPQTIRNWAKEGKIKMVHQPYHSKIRHAFIKVGLLPYEENLASELIRLKQEQENRRLHRMDGCYTRSQVAEKVGVSRETLARWDKAKKLVPTRINNTRYYTEDDIETAVELLTSSSSPRVKAKINELINEHELALATAS